ncbi:unnamed protein product [Clonostachys rosea f. rosea IK726]|uniref:N-acetyltransferase domain-containing protein n=2 Tax=Bionectria ochroleuca TaxID=29856 RepID=A0A0B7KA39_BIOOC|nr:unnamed protein product [Clonostachys rosea f. rosea IK726]
MAEKQNKEQSLIDAQIRELDESDQEFESLWQMWQTVFPDWPIERQRLEKMIHQMPGNHLIHEHGFCLSFLQNGVLGMISAVGVLPDHRRKGLGTALVHRAHEVLKKAAKDSGEQELQSLEVGSWAPRFWPQMPINMSQEVKDFFSHCGFKRSPDLGPRDLFKDIRNDDVVPADVLEKVAKTNIIYRPWSPELYEECLEKQRANFNWWKGYEILAQYGQHAQALVAIDPDTNAQVGWTFMCSPDAIISDMYAFLPLSPTKEKTGSISAVGIDPNFRGKGVGLGLVARAMENMKERGIEGIMVDSTWLRGFYEKLGFKAQWEYERWAWEDAKQ